jgi:FMN-dependent oxidoreductase (nitrilotriacetate monooxygenase family)
MSRTASTERRQTSPLTSQRRAHFIVFLTPNGYHEAGWRTRTFAKDDPIGLRNIIASTAVAERGLLDAVFFADRLEMTRFRAAAFPQFHFDPVEMLVALAMTTSRVGLIATSSTTFSTPFDIARRFATADHMSAGRVGWNVVTTYDPKSAGLFGTELPEHDDRYARASEFVAAAKQLWASWEDGALVRDPATGVWADMRRVHQVDFHGKFYDLDGTFSVPRSPQVYPVIAQAGSSPAGIELAGETADVVFTPQRSTDAAVAFRAKIDDAAGRHGRRAGDVRILPGLSFVLGGTETQAAERRQALEASVDPVFRAKNLALNAGIDPDLIDPSEPLSPELAATASDSSFAKSIVEQALKTRRPFGEVAATFTGLPGGLEFTGSPEQFADLVAEWVSSGASDGFTLQPATVPEDLERFVNDVVPILQDRGLFRRQYEGVTLRDHLGLGQP